MAAGIVVSARPRRPARPRTASGAGDLAAVVAARTAPRGAGLAPVVPLITRDVTADRGSASGWPPVAGAVGAPAEDAPVRPRLRVVPTPSRARSRRGRLVASLVTAVLVLGIATGVGRSAAGAPDELVAAGHVVLQPGETLWDVAVRSAPNGVDPRQQMELLRRLNGFRPGALDAWTVVLIPAR